MTKRVTLEITVDDDVNQKYPNYKMNFRTKEEFLKFIIVSIISEEDTQSFGYSIKIVKDDTKT